jgi:hypothetical protein
VLAAGGVAGRGVFPAWPWVVITLTSGAVAYGLRPIADLVGLLPLVGLADHSRLLIVVHLGIAVLAARGVECLGDPRARRTMGIALAALGTALAWHALGARPPRPSLLAAGASLGFAAALLALPRALPAAAWLAVGLVVADLYAAYGPAWSGGIRAFPPAPATLEALADQPGGDRALVANALLPPNVAAFYDVPTLAAFEPSMSEATVQLLVQAGLRPSFHLGVIAGPTLAPSSLRVLDLLGTGLVVLSDPVDDETARGRLEELRREPFAVYRNPQALPRLFVASDARAAGDAMAALAVDQRPSCRPPADRGARRGRRPRAERRDAGRGSDDALVRAGTDPGARDVRRRLLGRAGGDLRAGMARARRRDGGAGPPRRPGAGRGRRAGGRARRGARLPAAVRDRGRAHLAPDALPPRRRRAARVVCASGSGPISRLGMLRLVATLLALAATASCTREPPTTDLVMEPVADLVALRDGEAAFPMLPACAVGDETRAAIGCLFPTRLGVEAGLVPEGGAIAGRRYAVPAALAGHALLVERSFRQGPQDGWTPLPPEIVAQPAAQMEISYPLPADAPAGPLEVSTRASVLPPPEQTSITKPVSIGRGAVLTVGVALAPVARTTAAAVVEARLLARTSGGDRELLKAVLDPKDPDTGWLDHRVALDELAGQSVRFVMTTRPRPGAAPGAPVVPLWGAPRVLEPRPRRGAHKPHPRVAGHAPRRLRRRLRLAVPDDAGARPVREGGHALRARHGDVSLHTGLAHVDHDGPLSPTCTA